MGHRASVVFFDRSRVSPTVYLHWHGDAVRDWIGQLKDRMTGRFGDATYAAARFLCGQDRYVVSSNGSRVSTCFGAD
jgi:hypothetical protein